MNDRDEEKDRTSEQHERPPQRPPSDRHDEPDENGGAAPPQERTARTEQRPIAPEPHPEPSQRPPEHTRPSEHTRPTEPSTPEPASRSGETPEVMREHRVVNGYLNARTAAPTDAMQSDTDPANRGHSGDVRASIRGHVEDGRGMTAEAEGVHHDLSESPPDPEPQYSGGEKLTDEAIDERLGVLGRAGENRPMPTREELAAEQYDPQHAGHKREYAQNASSDGVVAMEYGSGVRRQDYGTSLDRHDDATRADVAAIHAEAEKHVADLRRANPGIEFPDPDPVAGHEVLHEHTDRIGGLEREVAASPPGPERTALARRLEQARELRDRYPGGFTDDGGHRAALLTEPFGKDFLGEKLVAGDFRLVSAVDMRTPGEARVHGDLDALRILGGHERPDGTWDFAELAPRPEDRRTRPPVYFVWTRIGPL